MSGQPNVELREFLRSRRARVTPAAAGLPSRLGARRVPGLRREEVAQLAGVSVDYYVRLERGRTANVSESVLDGVARALQLNDLERTHLFTLAKPSRSRPRPFPPQHVRPGLQLVVDSMTEVPVLVLGRRLDVLAANSLARALYTDFDALPPHFRNMARLIFLHDHVRSLCKDWPTAAQGIVANLRLYAGRYPHDPALAELVGRPRRGPAHVRREALPPRPGRRPGTGIRGIHPDRRSRTDPVGDHRATGICVRRTAESTGELGCATGRGERLNTMHLDRCPELGQ